MHGTGCTFASALAAGLALGHAARRAAAARAQQYVAGAIAHGFAIGHGARRAESFLAVQSIPDRISIPINDQMTR